MPKEKNIVVVECDNCDGYRIIGEECIHCLKEQYNKLLQDNQLLTETVSQLQNEISVYEAEDYNRQQPG